MKYIQYSPVDRQFLCLQEDLPAGAPFNAVDPVDGITFKFALESRYPLVANASDTRYGTIANDITDNPAINLRVITKAEFDTVFEAEQTARNPSVPTESTFIPIDMLRQRIEKLGMLDDFGAYLMQKPGALLKVFSLPNGVDPNYPDIIEAFDNMKVPQEYRDYILALPSMGVPNVEFAA